MRGTNHAFVGVLTLSILWNINTWARLNTVRASRAYDKAMEFASKLDGSAFLSVQCDEYSMFASSKDCSVVLNKRPVFFHCDENQCTPTCGGAK